MDIDVLFQGSDIAESVMNSMKGDLFSLVSNAGFDVTDSHHERMHYQNPRYQFDIYGKASFRGQNYEMICIPTVSDVRQLVASLKDDHMRQAFRCTVSHSRVSYGVRVDYTHVLVTDLSKLTHQQIKQALLVLSNVRPLGFVVVPIANPFPVYGTAIKLFLQQEEPGSSHYEKFIDTFAQEYTVMKVEPDLGRAMILGSVDGKMNRLYHELVDRFMVGSRLNPALRFCDPRWADNLTATEIQRQIDISGGCFDSTDIEFSRWVSEMNIRVVHGRKVMFGVVTPLRMTNHDIQEFRRHDYDDWYQDGRFVHWYEFRLYLICDKLLLDRDIRYTKVSQNGSNWRDVSEGEEGPFILYTSYGNHYDGAMSVKTISIVSVTAVVGQPSRKPTSLSYVPLQDAVDFFPSFFSTALSELASLFDFGRSSFTRQFLNRDLNCRLVDYLSDVDFLSYTAACRYLREQDFSERSKVFWSRQLHVTNIRGMSILSSTNKDVFNSLLKSIGCSWLVTLLAYSALYKCGRGTSTIPENFDLPQRVWEHIRGFAQEGIARFPRDGEKIVEVATPVVLEDYFGIQGYCEDLMFGVRVIDVGQKIFPEIVDVAAADGHYCDENESIGRAAGVDFAHLRGCCEERRIKLYDSLRKFRGTGRAFQRIMDAYDSDIVEMVTGHGIVDNFMKSIQATSKLPPGKRKWRNYESYQPRKFARIDETLITADMINERGEIIPEIKLKEEENCESS